MAGKRKIRVAMKVSSAHPHGLIFDRLAEVSGGVRQETPTANTDKPD
jgi:hypothetical protein